MDLRIGVCHNPKEIIVELPDDAEAEQVRAQVDEALGSDGTLWVTDRKGRQVGVPGERVAYVEIGRPDDGRRIGFGG